MSPQHVNGSTARRASNSEAATEACVPRSGRCSPTNEANREIRFEDWQQLVAYHQLLITLFAMLARALHYNRATF